MTTRKPLKYHLDRRAHQAASIVGSAGAPDELLSTAATAELLGISVQWLEIQRTRGGGPKYVRLGSRTIRYRRDDIVAWLKKRSFASTSEYRAAR